MSTDAIASPENMADLLEQLGDIPLQRIRLKPPPGTATKEDVIAALESPRKRICELVDGVLVEKPMGAKESLLAMLIGRLLLNYLDEQELGVVLGADGTLEIMPDLVRIPDVCFISAEKLSEGQLPDDPVPELVPDLAVEVWSEGNTKKEMTRKLRDYFLAGVQMVWLIYPKTQTAQVYTSPTKSRKVPKDGKLDGGTLLPGFTLSLKALFARATRQTGRPSNPARREPRS
jgi:Uma2 family endonuclease